MKRGVPCVRYADDIVLLAKSKRASERLLESSTKYLEEKLKLTVNRKHYIATKVLSNTYRTDINSNEFNDNVTIELSPVNDDDDKLVLFITSSYTLD